MGRIPYQVNFKIIRRTPVGISQTSATTAPASSAALRKSSTFPPTPKYIALAATRTSVSLMESPGRISYNSGLSTEDFEAGQKQTEAIVLEAGLDTTGRNEFGLPQELIDLLYTTSFLGDAEADIMGEAINSVRNMESNLVQEAETSTAMVWVPFRLECSTRHVRKYCVVERFVARSKTHSLTAVVASTERIY